MSDSCIETCFTNFRKEIFRVVEIHECLCTGLIIFHVYIMFNGGISIFAKPLSQ